MKNDLYQKIAQLKLYKRGMNAIDEFGWFAYRISISKKFDSEFRNKIKKMS